MSRTLIVIVGLIYAYIAVETGAKGNSGLSIMYAGYALGNIGLWILAA
jgi:hypothetical protein